jgi:glycosyltransferase 2 family protein
MKSGALLAAKIGVSLALLIYLFSTTDREALLLRVRGGDVLLFACAVALYAGMLAISTWRWRLLLEALGFPARLRDLTSSYLVATFFNNFLPSNIGGDVVRVRDSSKLTGSTAASLAVVAVDRILGLGALYLLAFLAFVLGGPAVRHLAGARVVLVGLGLAFAGIAWVFFRPGTARRLMAWSRLSTIGWVNKQFEIVQGAVHVYRTDLGAVTLAFGASVALQTLVVLYFYTVAHALLIPLPLPAALLMVPLCTLIQTVPITFNGWGLREGLFVVYFSQVGLPRDNALAFSLVGATLIVVLSLSGAVVWMSRDAPPGPERAA